MPRSSTATRTAAPSAAQGAAQGAAPTAPATDGVAAVPAARQPRRSRSEPAAAPLGSLTQRSTAEPGACPACGGDQLTSLGITLTDGTAVRFSSCRRCEHRRWETEDGELSITDVLAHTRRQP